MRAVHNISDWLPRTATWLHTQVRCLPPSVHSRVVCEQALNLDLFGDVEIRALSDEGRMRTIWDKGLRRLGLRRHLGFLSTQLREFRADVLHSHFGYTGWANQHGARRAGVAHVVTFYGYDVKQLPTMDPRWRDRYQEMFSDVGMVLCEGPYMANSIRELGCPVEKIRVHHLGVPTASIEFRPRMPLESSRVRVLMAGTFREKKGIVDGLEAVAALRDRYDLAVTIVGDATHDPRDQAEKSRILDTIARHRLEDCVTLLGFLAPEELMSQAYRHDIFVVPSVAASDGDTEGGAPVILTEMAATGIVLVGTTHCDIPNVIVPGETGFLAPERRPDELARQIARAIESSGDWSALGRRARARVETEFDAVRQGERLAGIYAELTR